MLLWPSSVAMVSISTGHTWSRNMEATFHGNPITIASPSCIFTICTEHTRSRNKEATFQGNPKTIDSAVEMVIICI